MKMKLQKKKTVRLTIFLERKKTRRTTPLYALTDLFQCCISVPSLFVIVYLCYLNLVKKVQSGYFYFSTKLVASSHRLKLTTFHLTAPCMSNEADSAKVVASYYNGYNF